MANPTYKQPVAAIVNQVVHVRQFRFGRVPKVLVVFVLVIVIVDGVEVAMMYVIFLNMVIIVANVANIIPTEVSVPVKSS